MFSEIKVCEDLDEASFSRLQVLDICSLSEENMLMINNMKVHTLAKAVQKKRGKTCVPNVPKRFFSKR